LLWKLATVHLAKGENETTLSLLDEAEDEYERILRSLSGEMELARPEDVEIQNLFLTLGRVKLTRARAFKAAGNYPEAKKEIEKGLEILEDKGTCREKAQAYNDLGNILFDQGDYNHSELMHKKGLELREKISDKKGIAEAYSNLAIICTEQGNYEKAAEMMEASIKLMREIGFREGIAGGYTNLGAILEDQGRYQDAYETHQRSLLISKEMGNAPGEILSHANLGNVCIDLGRHDEAIAHLQKCIGLMHTLNIRIHEPQVLVWMSRAFHELGRNEESKEAAITGKKLAEELKQKASLGFAERMLGVLEAHELRKSGQGITNSDRPDQIEKHFTESLRIFTDLKMEHEVGRTHLELAKFHGLVGNTAKSVTHLGQAREVLGKLGTLSDLKSMKAVESTNHSRPGGTDGTT
jgi:tetratricopeptide (TPR) repeat protein